MTNLTPERREEINLGLSFATVKDETHLGLPLDDVRTLLAASELLDAAMAEITAIRATVAGLEKERDGLREALQSIRNRVSGRQTPAFDEICGMVDALTTPPTAEKK